MRKMNYKDYCPETDCIDVPNSSDNEEESADFETPCSLDELQDSMGVSGTAAYRILKRGLLTCFWYDYGEDDGLIADPA